MSKKKGYVRVSTLHQDYELQVNKLLEYGVAMEDIYTDKKSGKNAEREGLKKVLEDLQPGDKLVAYKLDRIARNTKDLLEIVDDLNEREIGLVVLDIQGQAVDTSTPMGKFFITVLGAVAELERNLILERTQEGLALAKQKGVKFGRKKTNKKDYELALELYMTGTYTVKEVLNKFSNLSESTFYRRLREHKAKEVTG